MEHEESYQGQRVVVTTSQRTDGTWTFRAEVFDGSPTIRLLGGPQDAFLSEVEARRAGFSEAAATVDRARTSRGKP